MNVSGGNSDGVRDVESWLGFWIEGIVQPMVGSLGIAGHTFTQ